jgi:hypothetical protein
MRTEHQFCSEEKGMAIKPVEGRQKDHVVVRVLQSKLNVAICASLLKSNQPVI